MAAQRIEIEKALIVDVGDDQAQLVDVSGEEHARIALGIHRRETVAHCVFSVAVDRIFDVSVDHRLGLKFMPGRRAGIEQVDEEFGCLVGFV